MVYIAPDGRVLQSKPWGLHTITDFFWGIIAFFQLFFRTLIDPASNSKGEGYSTDYRNTGGRGRYWALIGQSIFMLVSDWLMFINACLWLVSDWLILQVDHLEEDPGEESMVSEEVKEQLHPSPWEAEEDEVKMITCSWPRTLWWYWDCDIYPRVLLMMIVW